MEIKSLLKNIEASVVKNGRGQKWAWSLWLRDSKTGFSSILKNELMKLTDFLHAATNSGKLEFTLTIICWVW